MIGVWLEDGRVAVRDDLPVPRPGADEARIRVLAAGICGTDLELLRGYRPFRGVPGHEFVGRVEEGPAEWLGWRVVGEINVTCRSRARGVVSPAGPGDPTPCRACAAGRPTHCERRAVMGIDGRDGAFAEHLVLPVGNLHRVPDAISDGAAALVEPLAAAFRILEQIEVHASDRVLVVGPGRLGRLVARVLHTTGCDLTVAGRSRPALERIEARGTRGVHAPDVRRASFDVAIDCTGEAGGFAVARAALRPAGTLVLKSTYAGELTLDASALAVDEITLLGSRCGPFPTAIEALVSRRVEVDDLIDDRVPLVDAVRAFGRAAEPGTPKVLLVP